MTTNEYVELIFQVKKEASTPHETDKAASHEVAQLVSGSFTYPLYQSLWVNDFDVKAITEHLESLYDSNNHFGLVYLIFILANAVNMIIPLQFSEMSANDALVPILSAAIIEDWLEYDATSEVTEAQ